MAADEPDNEIDCVEDPARLLLALEWMKMWVLFFAVASPLYVITHRLTVASVLEAATIIFAVIFPSSFLLTFTIRYKINSSKLTIVSRFVMTEGKQKTIKIIDMREYRTVEQYFYFRHGSSTVFFREDDGKKPKINHVGRHLIRHGPIWFFATLTPPISTSFLSLRNNSNISRRLTMVCVTSPSEITR